jgi:hypothetical protein
MTKGENCDIAGVTSLIRQFVPNATLKNEAGGEVVLTLPDAAQGVFAKLFEQLEQSKPDLGIVNFGLSVNTMEDVFLRVSPQTDVEDCEASTEDTRLILDNQSDITGCVISIYTLLNEVISQLSVGQMSSN